MFVSQVNLVTFSAPRSLSFTLAHKVDRVSIASLGYLYKNS